MTARHGLLLASFRAALAAVSAENVLPAHLPPPPKGRTWVIGAGKAAAAMAQTVERHWPASAPLAGLVITRHGHGLPTRHIEVVEAGHPLPDAAGVHAAQRLLTLLQGAGPDDLVLALISGGGSSLLTLPVPDLVLADIADVTRALLRSGATIQELNTVRKHLSLTLGGQLALATRTPVLALIVSDVCGDDPTHIASGPFSADASTYGDALAILSRHGINAPASVQAHLQRGVQGLADETPKPAHPRFAQVQTQIVATAQQALEAAAGCLARHDVRPIVLGDAMAGESRDLARAMAAQVEAIRRQRQPGDPPMALLSGGETTVHVKGCGRGGRNAEFLLALAAHLGDLTDLHALAADTDGIDGSEDNAGARLAPDTLQRALRLGLDPWARLDDNDAYGFFSALGDLVVTGPTRTNVNDYRVILID